MSHRPCDPSWMHISAPGACHICQIGPCPIPYSQYLPAQSIHIPHIQHFVHTPNPYTQPLVHTPSPFTLPSPYTYPIRPTQTTHPVQSHIRPAGPVPTPTPYTQPFVHTPKPSLGQYTQPSHPAQSLYFSHTPSPVTPSWPSPHTQPSSCTQPPTHTPTSAWPPDSSFNLCPGDMILNDFTALHML